MRAEEFKILMHRVAEAWSDGKIEKAADYYTESALNEFCGNRRPKPPIRIIWSHLSFDENEQIGFGEYKYQRIGVGDRTAHVIWGFRAIAMIRVKGGKISTWKEVRK
jgi:hypothetical protein